MFTFRVLCAILPATLTHCGYDDPEVARHRSAYERTYYVPSPWQNEVPLANRENPEDGNHTREVTKSW
jgi:hypothetical protein